MTPPSTNATPDALANRAALLTTLGRPDEAIDVLRQALRRDPHHRDGLLQLGVLLIGMEGFKLAKAAFLRVLNRDPNDTAALLGLAQSLRSLNDPQAALALGDRGLAIAPNDLELLLMVESLRHELCLWDDHQRRMRHLEASIQRCLAAGAPFSISIPMQVLSLPLAFSLPLQAGARFAASLLAAAKPMAHATPAPTPRSQGKPLHIGYLSADFRCHAMGGLIHGLFAQHDRQRCMPIGYKLSPGRDRFTRAVAEGCELFRDVSRLSNESLAQQIRDDAIDVLVDLMGYTHLGRPALLAMKPAPQQLLFLGYPASMGAPFMDGLIADPWLIPPELEHGYSEPVLRLPHAFLCSPPLPADPGELLPPAPSRQALGLSDDQLVFACFNRPLKFDPQRFALWMEILQARPGSALLLVVPEASAQQRLRQQASRLGVAPDRLAFAPFTPAAQFPDLCQLADLFLDTASYGAGATGAMALQAGLPLLTCPGQSFVSRMGASLCAAVGMEDLICPTPQAYLRRAIELGGDRQQLRQRRQRLLDPAACLPLFHLTGWVRQWEDLLHSLD